MRVPVDAGRQAALVAAARDAMSRGLVALAERICRELEQMGWDTWQSWEIVAKAAVAARRPDIARESLERARTFLAADRKALGSVEAMIRPVEESAGAARYLIIRAWGQGFWSDVDHVLGQALLAEITGRTPIVWWGENSRFRDPGETGDAWERFFEPLSDATLEQSLAGKPRFFPPKWNARNLGVRDNASFKGAHSRMAGLLFLGREETVAVSDFHTPVISLRHWLPASHPWRTAPLTEIYRSLSQRHLRPRPEIAARAGAIFESFGPAPIIAVHVRGSDKTLELTDVHALASVYHSAIASLLTSAPDARVLLLTDWEPAVREYRARYADRLLLSPGRKTSSTTGMHFQAELMGRQLGEEVLLDVLLAARCSAFVGLGYSNVSLFASYLSQAPAERRVLLGPSAHEVYNSFLLRPS